MKFMFTLLVLMITASISIGQEEYWSAYVDFDTTESHDTWDRYDKNWDFATESLQQTSSKTSAYNSHEIAMKAETGLNFDWLDHFEARKNKGTDVTLEKVNLPNRETIWLKFTEAQYLNIH